ncbi:STAS domain-containing protein [Actinospica sp. MGRD01-02]|uniref:STAS domain-containing protein n=1 Tax=Actinospica acidithermotolerans TaxID=2828514 RepID=A0A941EBV9_9ACTN|nr:STAS domain-containing protein [Actinospica acidithermotolerans]MBR7825019.1 STAS domain-containing protein [Actinospica acidithermotolerans]
MSHLGSARPIARVRSDAGGAPGLDLHGELDHDTVDDFREALDAVLAATRPGESIVVDCGRLEFCDSTGLAALLMAQRDAASRGAGITISGMTDYLRGLLAVTGVSALFHESGAPFGGATLERREGRAVVRLHGEIDDDCADEVRSALDEAAGSSPAGISVDVAGLRFADSTLLHLLLSVRERVPVRVLGPLRPAVRTLLEATGLIRVFDLAEGDGDVGGVDPQEVRA